MQACYDIPTQNNRMGDVGSENDGFEHISPLPGAYFSLHVFFS